MTCDVQALLTDGRCLSGNPKLGALSLALWCAAAEVVSNSVADHPALLSDDGNWYQLRVAGGTLQMGPQTETPGDNEYLVLVDLTDGLKYIFRLVGTGESLTWQIDDDPTLEAETPTTLYAGATPYTLSTVDEGSTWQLTPV